MAEQLGRYRLEEVIGVGSFATVHRAIDEQLHDVVVVKVLAENHSLNPEIRERFITEGRGLRRVVSPHVVAIHDIGESERQQPYLVLEHADRGTLADRITTLRAQGWVPSAADVLTTARSLAAAVEAVHQANLVHRDLSPGNVLLSSLPHRRGSSPDQDGQIDGDSWVIAADERLMVADLGMSKDLAVNSGLTVAGGTTGFRPPEQDGPGVIDTRADLWAMSRLLLWLCEGTGHALPESLFIALRRSTAVDPAHRHQDVDAWLGEIETALRPPAPVPVSPARAPEGDGSPRVAAAPGRDASRSTGPPTSTEAATAPGTGHAHGASTTRPRRRKMAVLTGLIVLLLVGSSAYLGGLYHGSSTPSQSAGASIAIEGPDQVTVGQEATFTAVTQDVEHWVWKLPTGEYLVDEPTVSITARSAGPGQLLLRARAPDGTELEIVHDVVVTE